ncbi:MAG: prolipoprotein diacylglyceryl transferase [Bacteroidetes bacterium]|nr:prolipoprotein diacylglyceryl transferase [Bacteroidota bacterium]
MHFPVRLYIGHYALPLHAVLETLAFFVGFRYFLYLRSRQGDVIESSSRSWIFVGAIFGALLGSRLVGGLENPEELLHSRSVLLHFYENKTVLGGFLGGLLGVELIKKRIGEKKASGDLFVYPILLALIIGRIGCFTMGVYEATYGTTTSLPWGMNLGDGLRRHPVALYEILFLVLLWLFLRFADRKWSLASGARFKIFMMAYALFRFLLDFIKPVYIFPFGLSTIQLTGLAGLAWYYRYIVQPARLIQPEYARKKLHLL